MFHNCKNMSVRELITSVAIGSKTLLLGDREKITYIYLGCVTICQCITGSFSNDLNPNNHCKIYFSIQLTLPML